MGWLLEPLAYPFIVRGLLAAILIGGVCAVLGTYVTLRGMAFFGDALAHAILPGVAVAYLARWPLSAGALAAGILAAAAIGYLQHRVREDTAIGIVFSGAFALGVVLLSTVRTYTVDLAHFLFGNVLGVSPSDLVVIAVLGGTVLGVTAAFHKELVVLAFDPVLATVLRLPASLLRYLLLLMLAVTVVASLQVVGVALVVAMLVTPPATAYLLTRRVGAMMRLAALFGVLSAIAGLYLSYYLDLPSGPAMVLVCTGIFLVALLFSRRKG
ncbi:MAG: metal ABC transporter permease [Anaerolineae bacterium]|nr:metal ABC transporter permease [Anaerolineae bacterium]MDW8069453.1 metal ABC transporter permease [Anaerolineae bacterium]